MSRGGAALVEPNTLRAILLLLYGAGLRVGEMLALSVADVDLANAVLTIWFERYARGEDGHA
jgi:site-specific recombinase XerD